MKNIHISPTYKLSQFIQTDKGILRVANNFTKSDLDFIQAKFVNINITNDDEEDKKIILTTDKDLIKDGVQAIDDKFLEWFVKNPSCESVEIEKMFNVVQFTSREFIYKIIIPKEFEMYEDLYGKYVKLNDRFETEHIWNKELALKNKGKWIPKEESKCFNCKGTISKEGICFCNREKPKQETLEEASERFAVNQYPYLDEFEKKFIKDDFIKGAKWQQERMYSEEDIALAFNEGQAYSVTGKLVDGKEWAKTHKKEWFEQFKKK